MGTIRKEKLLRKLTAALSDGKMLKETLYQVAAMFVMLRDPAVPTIAKAEVIAALLYLLNPLDLIPDMLAIGLVDDIALLGLAWNHVKIHITDEHREKARRFVLNILGELNLTKEIAP
ncbi:YkvA family protein [Candidatus Neomarinimicrobiota bacterium]